MQRNSCLVEAMMVVENARANDRLRKAGEVSLVRCNMSVDEVDEKGKRLKYLLFLSRYPSVLYFALKPGWVGSAWGRGTVSQCGETFYTCTR
jgi:hypothetical protein